MARVSYCPAGIFFAALVAWPPIVSGASDRVRCGKDIFQQEMSLAKLPAQVRADIGQSPLADPGQPFNSGDAVDSREPSRRLSIAAVSKSRVFLAVEHGGLAYNVEIWSFDLHSGHWRATLMRHVFQAPVSLAQLLYLTCDDAPIPQSEPNRQVLAFGATNPDGSVGIGLTEEPKAMYQLRKGDLVGSTMNYRILDEMRHMSPLSADARRELRSRLVETERRMSPDDSARHYIDEFLVLLNAEFGGGTSR